uniref:Adhesion G protein-coupled receptor D2 n=1 Tax=Dicentrarchus labrax TaxID=13489 RepID=A0A8C4HW09_DICLA
SHWAFQLVNDSLAHSRAESICRGQFSSLATLDQSEDREGALELLRQTGPLSPIWVRNPNLQFSALSFPKESREGFARVNMPFPALSSVSVCVRVQWNPVWNEVSTIFSYAAPVFTNEFQLRGQVDMLGRILLALIIHGKHLPYKASFPNDGAWHHICVTWHRSSGHWAIYVDGDRKDMGSGTDTSRDIYGDGIFILGQDQDSFGGNFTEPFFGNITDLNVWNMSLEKSHVLAFNACSPMAQEMLYSWNLDHLSSHPVVQEVQVLMFCLGKITFCICSHFRDNFCQHYCSCIFFQSRSSLFMSITVMYGFVYITRYLGTILGSSVISTTVLGDDQQLSTAVRFQLQHRVQAGGWWNTRGCEIVSKQYGYTVCYCNHTTNFALLLQVYEAQRSPENEKALQVLTFIGCGVSLCGLLFTFILFIAVGVPKSDRTTVHKNLIVALGIAELLLMCSDWASANEAACYMVTALLHLFFMASFSWMLVEGLLLWSKVVSVNISEDRRMKLYYIIGWGLPVLIVGVTLAVSVDEYKADDHCWLNVKTDTIWAFVGPVIFVLAVNAVVLCRVVMVTVSSARRRAKMLSPSSASKMQTFDLTWAVTRPVLILLPVLGLTWLCGVLVHLSVVVTYVFIALNAFQVNKDNQKVRGAMTPKNNLPSPALRTDTRYSKK